MADEDELVEVDLDNWPNCAVPDCENKACISEASDKCFPHTFGFVYLPEEFQDD